MNAGSPHRLAVLALALALGLLLAPASASAAPPAHTEFSFDWLDREYETTDPLGQTQTATLDVLGRVVILEVEGAFWGLHGITAQARGTLHKRETRYDVLGRPYKEIVHLFCHGGDVGTDPDAVIETWREFDLLGRVVKETNDNLHSTETSFDGFGRPLLRKDALGNQVLTTYDAAGNVLEQIEWEYEPGIAEPFSFTTTFAYDALGRRIEMKAPTGAITRFRYDSMGNMTLLSDSLGPEGATGDGGYGNLTVINYDGLGRRTEQVRFLSSDGRGSGLSDFTPAGRAISSRFTYDRSGRLIDAIDATDKVTRHEYDDCGRLEKISEFQYEVARLAEGKPVTERSFTYDAADRVIEATDPNGTGVQIAYDALGRPTQRTYTKATGDLTVGGGVSLEYTIEGVTSEDIEWNGLGQPTYYAEQSTYLPRGKAASETVTTAVWRGHDSLGRVVRERTEVNGERRTTSREYRGSTELAPSALHLFNASETLYDCDVTYAYDTLERPTALALEKQRSPDLAVTLGYRGPGRLREMTYDWWTGKRATTTWSYAGDEWTPHVSPGRNRLATGLLHVGSGGEEVFEYKYSYDDADRVRWMQALRRELGSGTLLASKYDAVHDSIGRLIAVSPTDGTGTDALDMVFDDVGNLTGLQSTTRNLAYAIKTGFLNQPCEVMGRTTSVSRNGALLWDGYRRLTYDCKNRLAAVEVLESGGTLRLAARYIYDGFDRRVAKFLYDENGVLTDAERFTYDGSQCLFEERSGFRAYYLHRGGLGAPLARIVTDEAGGNLKGQSYHCTQNLTVEAIVDDQGKTLRRYEVDAIGYARGFCLDGSDEEPLDLTADDNPYVFQGMWRERESEVRESSGEKRVLRQALYRAGGRHYLVEGARFLQRDAIGAWGDPMGHGNAYAFAGGSPLMYGDDGRAAHVLAGAIAGGIIGGAIAWYRGEDIGEGIAIGAISGAIGAATFGLALPAGAGVLGFAGAGAASGATAGAFEGFYHGAKAGYETGQEGEWLRQGFSGAKTGAAWGAAIGGVLAGAGRFLAGAPAAAPRGTISSATARRSPADLLPYDKLNKRIRGLHASLPKRGSFVLLPKRRVSMRQLRTLTRHTGDEYTMFTHKGQRLVIRGYGREMVVSEEMAAAIRAGRYGRFSGHTHPPGYSLEASLPDRALLQDLGQVRSGIWGDDGFRLFDRGFPFNIDDPRGSLYPANFFRRFE